MDLSRVISAGILILDHDLNFNDTTASNNHQLYNGSNLYSAPFIIIIQTQIMTHRHTGYNLAWYVDVLKLRMDKNDLVFISIYSNLRERMTNKLTWMGN